MIARTMLSTLFMSIAAVRKDASVEWRLIGDGTRRTQKKDATIRQGAAL